MCSKILIIGNSSDNHLKRLERYINEVNKDGKLYIEVFNINPNEKYELFKRTFHIKNFFPKFFLKIKFIRTIVSFLNYYLSFLQVGNYDVINIHFVTVHSYILLPLYKLKSKKIMISPWGSDVYRIDKATRNKIKKVYDAADYISVAKIQFRDDVKKIFSVSDSKLIDLGFGSENIDSLIHIESLTKEDAKNNLDLKNSFIISCGYNRSKAHNHLIIVDALSSIRDLLPQNTVLIFLMTYGPENHEYFQEIEKKLKLANFKYIIFYNFLSTTEVATIQKATDLFICIQDTDANSATLQEYLLCKTDIIIGEWLKYPQFEKYGLPYLKTSSKEILATTLKEYFTAQEKIYIPERLIDDIRQSAWSVKIKEWYNFYLSL
ncbi:glycosyltransferase [Petrimonas sulfuriphila]|jgi:hypothetical protein|uniref:glycosyltransferase n=1 Tax=Petrimonas sulfuriphila TaxID=285070 RepID=UPI003EB71274